MSKKIFLILLFIFSFQTLQAQTWVVNKDHSEILFQTKYLSLTDIHGRFKIFSGETVFKQEVPTNVLIKINSASIDTGNALRDNHLRGKEFFHSKLYPEIVFKSTSVKALKNDLYKMVGTLQIKDVVKEIAMEVTISSMAKDTWGYENKFVKFKSKINRSDFNIVWNKSLADQKFVLGEEVEFSGSMQIQPSDSKTPTSKYMVPDTKYLRAREQLNRGEITSQDLERQFGKVEEIQAKPVVEATPVHVMNVVAESVVREKTTLWWIAFFVMGLFGFFALIIVLMYAKTMFPKYFPRNYQENGILGFISDFAVMVIALIYSVALWFIAWGI